MNEQLGVRVVVVDDDAWTRSAIASCLASDPGISIVTTLADGSELIELGTEGVDVVLIDRMMGRLGGLETIQRLRSAGSSSAFLLMTALDDPDAMGEALAAGAVGYLLKTSEPDALIGSVRAAHAGMQVVSQSVADRLAVGARRVLPRNVPSLSPRESEVLAHLCAAASNQQIARAMHLCGRQRQRCSPWLPPVQLLGCGWVTTLERGIRAGAAFIRSKRPDLCRVRTLPSDVAHRASRTPE